MKLIEVSRHDAKPILVEGISHIDDLKIDKFLNSIKNLHTYSITEKVDGSNLWVGIDIGGRLYTTRAHKGGDIYRTVESWGDRFADVPFKSAHAALVNVVDLLKENGFGEGDVIEAEILYGTKPNAIPYNENQIIFLRAIEGDPDIKNLANALEGKQSTITTKNIPLTEDGRSIRFENKEQTWTFSQVHEYDIDFDKLNEAIKQPLYNLEKFLYAPNIAKFELSEHVPLTPRYKTRRLSNHEMLRLRMSPKNKETKMAIVEIYETYKKEIKDILLDILVRKQHSMLGPDDGWIEGVVLRRETNEGVEQIKLVDKEIFTAVNKFNHQVRNHILEKHRAARTPRENAGIRGNLLRDMATAIGHTELGTYQAKRYMETNSEALQESSENIANMKKECLHLIERCYLILEKALGAYSSQYITKEFVDSIGRIHKYDSIIHERTLQVFAETFKELNSWKEQINEAKTNKDLMEIIYGR